MKQLASDQTYQLWALTGDPNHPTAISAGVLGADPQAAAFRLAGDVHGFALTIEQAPGVVQTQHSRSTRPPRSPDRCHAARPWTVPFGVYVHIPFCAQRCDYCDFATWTDRAHLIDALRRRVRRGSRRPPPAAAMPTGRQRVLRRRHAVALARRAARAHPRRDRARAGRRGDRRVQPGQPRRATSWPPTAAAGVNRLSLGVQSMVPHVLARARPHPRSRATSSGASISRVTRDSNASTSISSTALRARRSPTGARRSTARLPSASNTSARTRSRSNPPHRSAAGSPRARLRPTTTSRPMRTRSPTRCSSTRATSGTRSRTGPGPARSVDTTSCTGPAPTTSPSVVRPTASHRGRRWWNVRTPDRYIAAVEAGSSPEAGDETLEPAARAEEAFALALRTRRGARTQPSAAGVVDELAAEDLLVRTGDRIVLTRRGRLLASDVTARLLLAGSAPPVVGTLYH